MTSNVLQGWIWKRDGSQKASHPPRLCDMYFDNKSLIADATGYAGLGAIRFAGRGEMNACQSVTKPNACFSHGTCDGSTHWCAIGEWIFPLHQCEN